MNRIVLLLAVLVLAGCTLAQTAKSPPGKIISFEDLDKFLAGRTLPECQKNFHECESKLTDLKSWADRNYPIGQQLAAENEQLRSELARNTATWLRVCIIFAALGFGIFMAFLVSRGVRRAWPLSFEHKQLAVLLLVAAWITVAVVFAVSDSRFWVHPMSSAFGVGVWSIPALVFGAVAFWWFGKKHPMRLF
jgi:ABC-type dipeptide/oligopeptide/nickel transport system permease component